MITNIILENKKGEELAKIIDSEYSDGTYSLEIEKFGVRLGGAGYDTIENTLESAKKWLKNESFTVNDYSYEEPKPVTCTPICDDDFQVYSDLHKDVYGVRPRNYSREDVSQEDFDYLCKQLELNNIQEEKAKKVAIREFEESVTKTMEVGNVNRKTAIKWLMEAEGIKKDTQEDEGYYCYMNNLPYDYFDKEEIELPENKEMEVC